MDYASALAQFSASDLPRCFTKNGPKLEFCRPRRVAILRAAVATVSSAVMLTWAWSLGSVVSLSFELICGLVLGGYAAVLVNRAVKGDVLLVLDRAGIHLGHQLVPWHTIRATRITDDGKLHLSIEAGVGGGAGGTAGNDRYLDFANADLASLQRAIETVAFGDE